MEGVRSDRFQRFAAVPAIFVAPSSYLLMGALLQAISFDVTILANPSGLVALGPGGAVVFKWTMGGDIFGQ